MIVKGLTCEHLVSPRGIDAPRPRLGWLIELEPSERARRGVMQAAYRVLVASSEATLNEDCGDLWDSGRVASEESAHLAYAGAELRSRMTCFWKVKVWDERGSESGWSAPASWTMGVFPADWRGEWIGARERVSLDERFPVSNELEDCPAWIKPAARREHPHGPGPENDYAKAVYLRKEFTINKPPARATVRVAGLGYHEVYVNGQKVGDNVLDPGATHYDKTVLYVSHDVTRLLHEGNNCIGVILGSGWYWVGTPDLFGFETAPWAAPPRCLLELELARAGDTSELVCTDATWSCTEDGPIRFNCIRSGEVYDARKELGEWSVAGGVVAGDGRWQAAKSLSAPKGVLRSQLIPPIKVQDTFAPCSRNVLPDGKVVYWFPKNNAGWVEIALRGEPGQTIMVELNEKLEADGHVDMNVHSGHTYGRYQTCEYTCKGGGVETWQPRFCYAGFQYVQVSGAKPDEIVSVLAKQVCTSFEPAGEFYCSNILVNAINEACKRTFKNGFHSYPQDCPQREKAGWTEDALLSAHGSVYSFDTLNAYEKWIQDLIDSQHASGQVPDIVPSPGWGSPSTLKDPTDHTMFTQDELGNMADPWWGGALVMLPWKLYEHYGDTRILERAYPAMKRYVDFLRRTTQYGPNEFDYMINWATILGEWLEVGSGGSANRTPRVLTCTQAFFRCADVVSKTAALLGKPDDEKVYKELAGKVVAAFNDEYLDKATGISAKDSQSAYAMALVLGMVPSDCEQKVFQQLVTNLVDTRKGHLSTGIVGTWFLYKALGQGGRPDLAYNAITAKGFPGFEHMLTRVNEKTPVPSKTIWEDWNGIASLAHPVQGCVVSFFYEYLAGIQAIEPGFKRFAVRPAVVGDLSWVRATLRTCYGIIQSGWTEADDGITFTIHVPANTTAEITLPDGKIHAVGSGTYTFTTADRNKKGK
ncbi:MAG: family 78 glycoside hydrolase catalytic domain [Candidatus Lokiarchaeota archaeon]|nr:family 78 glycoside hydrolase catalytic domain [Candidatus Lokiarchaeota archaeon]